MTTITTMSKIIRTILPLVTIISRTAVILRMRMMMLMKLIRKVKAIAFTWTVMNMTARIRTIRTRMIISVLVMIVIVEVLGQLYSRYGHLFMLVHRLCLEIRYCFCDSVHNSSMCSVREAEDCMVQEIIHFVK